MMIDVVGPTILKLLSLSYRKKKVLDEHETGNKPVYFMVSASVSKLSYVSDRL